jgi:hypothetical protein
MVFVQPHYQAAPEFVPLPPQFASRFRIGVIVVGITLIFGTLAFYGVMRFIGPILNPATSAAVLITGALPPLFVLATAVTLLTARRCLYGDHLIVARARTTRNVLVVCVSGTVACSLLAVVVPVLVGARAGAPDLLGPLVFLFLGTIGFLVGLFYVRPSANTLRKFTDRPIW